MSEQIVIIGAGQAGAQAAASLRAGGFSGSVVMIGAERHPPYQRPPLSKAFLKGELAEDRLYLRPRAFYEQERIELRIGRRAIAIERAAARVHLDDGASIPYDRLLYATGAPPRRLDIAGSDLAGIHYLRTLEDSAALRPLLSAPAPLAVIGAGYIGLEAASVARAAGRDVVVIESAARPLARVAGAAIADFYAALHGEMGVRFRFGAGVAAFEGDKRVSRIVLNSGETIACGAAIVGVGAAPATALAAAAGLAVDNGVVVDEAMRTSDPSIFAAGDVANFPSRLYGRRMRLESVPGAIDQAKTAAQAMLGRPEPYDSVPWFWSDQYDVKLQTAGISAGADASVLRQEGPRKLSVFSLAGDRLLAVDAVNDPAAFVLGKRLIAAKARVDAKELADPAFELKSLLL